MTRWRWVLFDLDGTLANTIPLIIASYDHAMRSVLGVPADRNEATRWIGQTLKHTFGTLHPDRAEELIEAYVEFNLRQMGALIERYPGMVELVDQLSLAGIGCGVATSKRRPAAELTLTHVGLEDHIAITVAMDDTDVHKPDPAPLRLALARMGANPDESVYIGDAVVDVQAAKAAGMAAIAVTWGAGEVDALRAAAPTAVATTTAQLRALLLP
ncbi:MAG: HAD family hydrolase [Actinobacteria bacterium HGW-Actinobacteria-2]|nr:MAG: HAD family hydrolase [Actinobacteria bacterium HGW-Actinobacteria-2]